MSEPLDLLQLSEEMLRRIARERLAGASLLSIFFRQATSEHFLKYLRGVDFRQDENAKALRAYRAMTAEDFEAINARQRWANWRTLPRNLSGHVPDRPLSVIDLCCGIGHSTEVLACYLPVGSSILGLEFNPDFVRVARARAAQYQHRSGALIQPRFAAQSVLETFRDEGRKEVSGGSVDLVNCSGAVGVHFKPDATRVLAKEIARVLRPGGIALIDSGPRGTSTRALTEIFDGLGFKRLNAARSCFVDYSVQVCFRKEAR